MAQALLLQDSGHEQCLLAQALLVRTAWGSIVRLIVEADEVNDFASTVLGDL